MSSSLLDKITPKKKVTPRTDKADTELLGYLNSLYERSHTARLKHERQWHLNLAFYSGRQYVQWINLPNNNFSKLHEPSAPPWRVRLVINKIRPSVRHEIAKIVKEFPRGFVIPSTDQDEDMISARAGNSIVEHVFRETDYRVIQFRACFWQVTCGVSYTKTWWDGTKIDPFGGQGDICIAPLSPFYILVPDPVEPEIEEQICVIHESGKDPAWLEAAFGLKLPPSKSDGEQKMITAMSLGGEVNKDFVAVREFWHKPHGKFPDGAKIIATKDKIIHISEEWPWDYKPFPFQKLESIQSGGFYTTSFIDDFIPLQREYNRRRSQLIEIGNKTGNPQMLAPRGSVDPTKITSQPGLIITYTPGLQPPQFSDPPTIPAYMMQELDTLQQEMNDISSQHEITRGGTPPGVTAATAIGYLQEQDDSKLSYAILSIEKAVEKTGRQILSHAIEFWQVPRLVKVVGEHNLISVQYLMGSDLNGNTDYRVEAGSGIPSSRAAKQAFIMELGKMGWISPAQALKYLDMAETGKIYQESQVDSRQAQRENLLLKSGNQIQTNMFDNHLIHIIEHDLFRKTEEYLKLDPQVKYMVDFHSIDHRYKLAAAYGQIFELPQFNPMLQQLIYPPTLDGFIYNLMAGIAPQTQSQPQQTSNQRSSYQDLNNGQTGSA